MAASALTQELLPPEEVHLASVLSLHGTEDQACPYDGGRRGRATSLRSKTTPL